MLTNIRPYFYLLDKVKKSEQASLVVKLDFLKLRLRQFVNSLDILVNALIIYESESIKTDKRWTI